MAGLPGPADERYSHSEICELIRHIAAREWNLQLFSDTVAELLWAVYNAGGNDAAAGLLALGQLGVPINVVTLDEP